MEERDINLFILNGENMPGDYQPSTEEYKTKEGGG